jgi:hypothetical protein
VPPAERTASGDCSRASSSLCVVGPDRPWVGGLRVFRFAVFDREALCRTRTFGGGDRSCPLACPDVAKHVVVVSVATDSTIGCGSVSSDLGARCCRRWSGGRASASNGPREGDAGCVDTVRYGWAEAAVPRPRPGQEGNARSVSGWDDFIACRNGTATWHRRWVVGEPS